MKCEDHLLSALDPAERSTLATLLRKLLVAFERRSFSLPAGLTVAPAHVSRAMRAGVGLSDRPGLLVTDVEPGSAAATSGILRGDLLVAAAGRELLSPATLEEVATSSGPIKLEFLRGETVRTVSLPMTSAGKVSDEHSGRG